MRLIVSCLLILCFVLPVRAEQELTFSFTGDPMSAASLAVLKAAYARLGIQVDGKLLPASRALVESDAGRTDGEVHRIKAIAPQHPNLILISVPVNKLEGMAFSCIRTFEIEGWDSLKELHVGVRRGIKYSEKNTKDLPHVTILKDADALFELLRMNRLDVVVTDRVKGEEIKARTGEECFIANEPPLIVIPLYHYLHKKNAEMVPRLTAVLEDMAASGEMQAIRERTLREIYSKK